MEKMEGRQSDQRPGFIQVERPATQCLLAISLIWMVDNVCVPEGKGQSACLYVFPNGVFKCTVKLFIFHSGSQHFIQTELSSTQCSIKCLSIFALSPLVVFLSDSPPLPLSFSRPHYLCQSYRKQTWPWQASPSRQRGRKLLTSLSRS